MRRARLTYQGAFHHCMNRGHNGNPIFAGDAAKMRFLDILAESSQKLKIRVLAYCLLDNHYHLAVENTSGRMSDFFKLMNGEYGIDYRRRHGGRGYVFQNRYQSTILQDESYLLTVIAYVLANPVRAGLVKNFKAYPWSSARLYFTADQPDWIDCGFVESLYGTQQEMTGHVRGWQSVKQKLPIIYSEIGPVIAAESAIEQIKDRFDRRSESRSQERKRKDDIGFAPLAMIYQEFEKKHRVKVNEIDCGTRHGQRLRRELLVNLRDYGGLKYREIVKLAEFNDVKLNSLGKMYQDAKECLRPKNAKTK